MTTVGTEERLARLESRQAGILTKEDLARFEARLVKWMVGAFMGSAMIASTLTVLIDRVA